MDEQNDKELIVHGESHMRVAIIGNGPSYKLFDIRHPITYDLIVGCNMPPDIKGSYDFTVIGDEKAVIKAIREDKTHERMPLVLGPRAMASNDICKFKPGGRYGLIAGLKRAGGLLGSVEEPKNYTNLFRRKGYFSSGHLAFKYVVENYDLDTIDMYGFDSLFTGKQTTYTDYKMGGVPSEEEALNPKRKKHVSPPIWYKTWCWFLHEIKPTDAEINFITFESNLPMEWDLFKDNVKMIPILE